MPYDSLHRKFLSPTIVSIPNHVGAVAAVINRFLLSSNFFFLRCSRRVKRKHFPRWAPRTPFSSRPTWGHRTQFCPSRQIIAVKPASSPRIPVYTTGPATNYFRGSHAATRKCDRAPTPFTIPWGSVTPLPYTCPILRKFLSTGGTFLGPVCALFERHHVDPRCVGLSSCVVLSAAIERLFGHIFSLFLFFFPYSLRRIGKTKA